MNMRNATVATITAALLAACTGDRTPMGPPGPPPPAPVLLKEIVSPDLPAPYYHFEYDAENRIKTVSYAYNIHAFDVIYDGDRIAEMRSTLPFTTRAEYSYY